MTRLAAGLIPLAILATIAAGSAGASETVPRACQLLSQPLVEGYFHSDMTKSNDNPKACQWHSRVRGLNKGANLTLTTWALASNAASLFAAACQPRKGIQQLRLQGATKACGSVGPTGLCLTPPKGEDPKEWCAWDVKVAFLRGATTGSIELTSLHIFTLNNLTRGAALARQVLAAWK
jgi:hypothetical protein